MTAQLIRISGIVSGIGLLIVAGALFLQLPDIWPWTGVYSRLPALGYMFLASVSAAAGLPLVWIFWSRHYRAIAPLALVIIVTIGAAALFMLQSHFERANERALVSGLFAMLAAVVGVGMFIWGQRQPLHETRKTPTIVRFSFAFFVVALLIAGSSLVLKMPNIFPWSLTPEASVLYGWAFIGAASYFLYGVLFPNWSLAIGQLLGFFIYDLILILPFLQHASTVPARFQTSLAIYLSVITFSLILSSYYLFINPSTRIWRSAPALTATV